MKRPKSREVLKDLGFCDPGCSWFGSGKKNEIIFDDDAKGNGIGPFLYLRFGPKAARFSYGLNLKRIEKQKRFEYEKYEKISDFTEALTEFTQKYFKSFKLKRK